jgi:hypothetical protein
MHTRKLLNNFLNNFEHFLRRVFIAFVGLLIVPFILLGYIFGLFHFNVEKKNDDNE